MNTDKLRKYVTLTAQKRELMAELDELRECMDVLEAELVEAFADEGIQNVNLDGHTVYLQSQLWAGPVEGDYERACDALDACGLSEFVGRRFNSNTLSAWVREHVQTEGGNYPENIEEALPVALAGAIKVDRKWSVRVRKAAGKGRR